MFILSYAHWKLLYFVEYFLHLNPTIRGMRNTTYNQASGFSHVWCGTHKLGVNLQCEDEQLVPHRPPRRRGRARTRLLRLSSLRSPGRGVSGQQAQHPASCCRHREMFCSAEAGQGGGPARPARPR